MIVLIDVVCPSCRATNGCLPPDGGPLGVRCRTCSIDFVAKMVGRAQLYRYGRDYERSKPCRVEMKTESLLPKDEEKETAVEKPMVVIRDFKAKPLIVTEGPAVNL